MAGRGGEMEDGKHGFGGDCRGFGGPVVGFGGTALEALYGDAARWLVVQVAG